VLKEDEEDQLDRSCEKWKSVILIQGQEYPTYSKKEEGGLDCYK